MADDSGNQSTLSNIGLAVVAVLAAVTAARTFSLQDARPTQAELGQAAATQGAVVYSQLWQDPFQAVDRYFQTYNPQANERVAADAHWLAFKIADKLNEIENSRNSGSTSGMPSRIIEVVERELNYTAERLSKGVVEAQEIDGDEALLTDAAKVVDEFKPGGDILTIESQVKEDGSLACTDDNQPAIGLTKGICDWLKKLDHLRDGDIDRSAGTAPPTVSELLMLARKLKISGLQLDGRLFEAKLRDELAAGARTVDTQKHSYNQRSADNQNSGNDETQSQSKAILDQIKSEAGELKSEEKNLAKLMPSDIRRDSDPSEMDDSSQTPLKHDELPIVTDFDRTRLASGYGKLLEDARRFVDRLSAERNEIESQINQAKQEQDDQDDVASANPCGKRNPGITVDRPPNECVHGSYDSTNSYDRTHHDADKSGTEASVDFPKMIAVMVNDGSFESKTEDRRRQRYSVVTALEMSGYKPEDVDHIHLTRLSRLICGAQPHGDIYWGSERTEDDKRICDAAKQRPCEPQDQRGCVPFERFELKAVDDQLRRGRSKEILLLWLRDDDIFHLDESKGVDGSKGLLALQLIAQNVYSPNEYTKTALAVLGPPNSGSLQALYSGMKVPYLRGPPCKPGDHPCYLPHPGLHLFDVHATKALPFELDQPIYPSDPKLLESIGFPECVPGNQGFCFSRTGVPDAKLADALALELRLRGLYDHAFRTVLLVDGASPLTLSLSDHLRKDLKTDVAATPGALPADILSFFYYPGVDGQLTGEFSEPGAQLAEGHTVTPLQQNAEGQQSDMAGPTHAKTDISEAGDYATGSTQIDYIRRLGIALKTRNTEKPIGAIGIVSNDIYDTLDIIQTLRPLFPHALMFTNFVNAQMADRGVTSSTRGLIVASKFGLDAAPLSDDTRDIPEFRDQFGTADFLTALYVAQCDINSDKVTLELPATDVCDNVKSIVGQRGPEAAPAIFEVGNSGAPHRLPNSHEGAPAKHQDADLDILGNQLTGVGRALLGLAGIAAICAIRLVNGCVAGRPIGSVISGNVLWARKHDGGFWGMVLAFFMIFGVMLFWSSVRDFLTEAGDGEPLGWVDGIGLWPTVWLQIADCGLACWFIYLVVLMLNQSAIRLAKKFGFGEIGRESDAEIEEEVRARLRNISLARAFVFRLPEPQPGVRADIKLYWDHYLERCSIFARAARSFVYTLAVVLAILFFNWAYPADPLLARGPLVRNFYAWSSLLSSGAIIFLTSLVFDATVNSVRFVQFTKDARSKGCRWPEKTKNTYVHALGFDALCVEDWIDLQFTSLRTTVILRLVWFPFLVVGLYIVARGLGSRATEAGFVATVAIACAMLIGCVVALRLEAEGQRKNVVRKLRKCLSRLGGSTMAVGDGERRQDGNATQAQIILLTERALAMDEGAFASALNQPVLKAIFVPIGAGVWPLLAQQLGR